MLDISYICDALYDISVCLTRISQKNNSMTWHKGTGPLRIELEPAIPTDGSWDFHIGKSIEKAWKRIGVMRLLKTRLDRLSLQIYLFLFYKAYSWLWRCYMGQSLSRVERSARKSEAARIVTGCIKLVAIADLY